MWTSKTWDSSRTAGVCVLPPRQQNECNWTWWLPWCLQGARNCCTASRTLGTAVKLSGVASVSSQCFSSKCLSSSWWLSMSENRWKEKQVTTEIFLVLFFFLRIGWGCCFCKGYLWENKSEEHRAARHLFEIFSNFSEESGRACPFHWTPCEYFLIKK